MELVLSFFLLFLMLYAIILAVIYLLQERLVFKPWKLEAGYEFRFEGPFEEHWLKAGPEGEINALLFKTDKARRGVVLYLHGNRGNLQGWAEEYSLFTPLGYDFLVIDYRGFGKSTGLPSEQGIYEDAETAYLWLKERYPEDSIVVYGRSLGSAAASWLGMRHHPRLLALETPYDNIPNVIRAQAGLALPSCLFRLHFRNDHYLKSQNAPVYVFAGTQDQLVPFRLSLRLRPLLPSPAHFIVIRQGEHHNLSAFPHFREQLQRILDNGRR